MIPSWSYSSTFSALDVFNLTIYEYRELTLGSWRGGHWGPSLAVTGRRKLAPFDQKKARRWKLNLGSFMAGRKEARS